MNDFMSGILGHLQTDVGKSQMYGAGLALSQLSAGQPVNIGPALERVDMMRGQQQLRDQMQGGGFMDMFSPDEQAYLATLPPSVAQELIGQRVFAQPTPVEPHFTAGGLVLDPMTGAVIADHRTPDTPTAPSSIREYEFARQQGFTGSFADWQAQGSSAPVVNVNTGDPVPEIGSIPQGYEVFVDPQTGQRAMRPIPGGPEDTSTADANRTEGAAVSSVNVLETIGDLRTAVENSPNLTTGLWGSLFGNIPGSEGYDANALTNTIRSNLAFDQLQAMREASPTGGALGAVSAPELTLLESNLANLDLGQSTEQVMRQLEVIERDYTRILRKAYDTGNPAELDAVFGGRPDFLGMELPPPPEGVTASQWEGAWSVMTPEERALFQ